MSLFIEILIIIISIFPKINIIGAVGSTGIRAEDLLIGIFVVFSALYLKYQKDTIFKSKKFLTICLVFSIYFLINVISTFWGYYKGWISLSYGLLFCIRKVEYFVLIVAGWNYFEKCDYKRIVIIADFIMIFHLLYSLLQYKGYVGSFNGGMYLNYLTQGRISSTFNGSYEFTAFLVLIIPLYMEMILNHKGNIIHNIFFIGVSFILIVISRSRSSLVLILAILAYMLIRKKFKKYFDVLFKYIVFIFGAACIVLILSLNVIDLSRFSTLKLDSIKIVFDETWEHKSFEQYLADGSWWGTGRLSEEEIEKYNVDGSLYLRVSHWMQMIDGFIKSPVIGTGDSISQVAADGNYVRIICESGILGISVWILLLFVMCKELKNDKLFNNIVFYSMLSVILGAIFIDLFEASKIMMMFWFMIGFVLHDDYSNGLKEKSND